RRRSDPQSPRRHRRQQKQSRASAGHRAQDAVPKAGKDGAVGREQPQPPTSKPRRKVAANPPRAPAIGRRDESRGPPPPQPSARSTRPHTQLGSDRTVDRMAGGISSRHPAGTHYT